MLKELDAALDVAIYAWSELLGLYDRCFLVTLALLGITTAVYPAVQGPCHIMIPEHVFWVVLWLLALPFLSMFMFIEAGHWEDSDQLVRIVLGTVLMAAFVLIILVILNDAYAYTYNPLTPYPYVPNAPPATPIPYVGIA